MLDSLKWFILKKRDMFPTYTQILESVFRGTVFKIISKINVNAIK